MVSRFTILTTGSFVPHTRIIVGHVRCGPSQLVPRRGRQASSLPNYMDGGTRTLTGVDSLGFGWIGGCSVLVVDSVVQVAGEIPSGSRETGRWQRKIRRVVRQR
jgi:hypothetical protein